MWSSFEGPFHDVKGIEGHVRERLLLERIEQLQAEHKRAEEANKAAKEQAFRCASRLCVSVNAA